uniref:Uncharacterized protein n=1 Tax=Aegilops tauschii subsp. strangulata TaxID=200361 RepID=A0A453HGZ4_AEGTS
MLYQPFQFGKLNIALLNVRKALKFGTLNWTFLQQNLILTCKNGSPDSTEVLYALCCILFATPR